MKISFRINLLKNDFNSHEKSYEIFFTRTPHYKMLSLVEWHYAKEVIFSKSGTHDILHIPIKKNLSRKNLFGRFEKFSSMS